MEYCRNSAITGNEYIKFETLLEQSGWLFVRQKASHRLWKSPSRQSNDLLGILIYGTLVSINVVLAEFEKLKRL